MAVGTVERQPAAACSAPSTRCSTQTPDLRLQRDLDDGVSADGRRTTVAALSLDWLRQSSGELSRNTVELPTWAVRQHLVPVLGARRVRELSADGSPASFRARPGCSRASLDEMRGVLVQALRHAERQGLVVRNVAALVPAPSGPRARGRSLTVAQAIDLLTAARGHLAEHRTRHEAQGAAVGEHWQELGLVFPTGLGTLLDPADPRRGPRQVPETAGSGAGTRTSCGTAPRACCPQRGCRSRRSPRTSSDTPARG